MAAQIRRPPQVFSVDIGLFLFRHSPVSDVRRPVWVTATDDRPRQRNALTAQALCEQIQHDDAERQHAHTPNFQPIFRPRTMSGRTASAASWL
jgi:hypothetical protein